MTRTRAKLAIPMSPEDHETLEVLLAKKLMHSLWKAEEGERDHRVVEHIEIFR